jgi:hypothetical protein
MILLPENTFQFLGIFGVVEVLMAVFEKAARNTSTTTA